MIYLDHNATTPLDPRVREAMLPWLGPHYGNPSSLHRLGRAARDAVEQARAQVAALVGVSPEWVVFTSGGTEANNAALAVAGPRQTVAVSAIEHASVLETARRRAQRGGACCTLPVTPSGRVDLEAAAARLHDERPALVSVMWANNETGVLQPVAEVAALARELGAWMHTDAVQAAGKVALDFSAAGVHMMSLSAHKLYGPKGVGALILDPAVPFQPLLHGGGHEKGRRAGTENVPGIVGFGVAAELARHELEARARRLEALRARLEARLRSVPGVALVGADAPRVPNTCMLRVPGIDGETLVLELDQEGIAVASGSACHSGSTRASHVLTAMGIPPEQARGALRVSLGKDNSEDDIEAFVAALEARLAGLARFAGLADW